MSASKAILGKGTTFGYNLTTNTPFTTFAEVTAIGAQKTTYDSAEVTRYDSPSGMKEFIQGWGDAGQVPVTLNYLPASIDLIYNTLAPATTAPYFQILTPVSPGGSTGSSLVFQAFIKEVGTAVPNKEKISNDFAVKVTGPVTVTKGT